jgi:hypothetical protein
MKIELKIRIKHHNKISEILNRFGLNIMYSGLETHKFYIYSLSDNIHSPMSKRIIGELKDWKIIIKSRVN